MVVSGAAAAADVDVVDVGCGSTGLLPLRLSTTAKARDTAEEEEVVVEKEGWRN